MQSFKFPFSIQWSPSPSKYCQNLMKGEKWSSYIFIFCMIYFLKTTSSPTLCQHYLLIYLNDKITTFTQSNSICICGFQSCRNSLEYIHPQNTKSLLWDYNVNYCLQIKENIGWHTFFMLSRLAICCNPSKIVMTKSLRCSECSSILSSIISWNSSGGWNILGQVFYNH